MSGTFILITCEHATNAIPREFKKFFTNSRAKSALYDHRGYDHGALDIAVHLSQALQSAKIPSAFFRAGYSRLLVDLNRSSHHKNVVDRLKVIPDIKSHSPEILARYYQPYRESIEKLVLTKIKAKKHVIHLSIHSLTPKLGNQQRKNPISLLYDPKIKSEKCLAQHLRSQLSNSLSLTPSAIRYNYPYLGTSDGLIKHLRRLPAGFSGMFSGVHSGAHTDTGSASPLYVGLEIEFNQSYLFPNLTLNALYAPTKSPPTPAKSLVTLTANALIQALKTFNISPK